MKKINLVLIISVIILSISIFAFMNKSTEIIPLIGKIGYGRSTPNGGVQFNIFSKSGKSKFELEFNKDTTYSIQRWMNNKDLLCGYQTFYYEEKNQDLEIIRFKEVKVRPERTDIIFIDTLGNLDKVLFQGEEMVRIGHVFPSPSDKKLFFTTKKLPSKVNDLLELGNIPISFNVYDLNKKKVTIQQG